MINFCVFKLICKIHSSAGTQWYTLLKEDHYCLQKFEMLFLIQHGDTGPRFKENLRFLVHMNYFYNTQAHMPNTHTDTDIIKITGTERKERKVGA